uniref:Uncharacterized protein n=1 Tax=Gracilaria vermiculophylla TaxID=2608709 RepID=A0A345U989_9FLOR|nr:hypothetical protein [Gracilaria vermiculophylla]AXI97025.1 hypothetical protein [Gracilaria vermiculophylla]WDZ68006.1 hypothetical protein [Gracilaria vermiculophylla]
MRCGNSTRKPTANTLYNFKESIKIIYDLYNSSHNSKIQQNINNILKMIYVDHELKSEHIKQYLRRFKYIYYKTQNYYNISSKFHIYNQYIEEIAIYQLYILYRLSHKDGIYFLIKYLRLPSFI